MMFRDPWTGGYSFASELRSVFTSLMLEVNYLVLCRMNKVSIARWYSVLPSSSRRKAGRKFSLVVQSARPKRSLPQKVS
jgi:hypothetical protein